MYRRKKKIPAILSSAALLLMFAGTAAGQAVFQPVTASASAYSEQYNYASDGYAFLTRGNPPSTRERIAAKYQHLFVDIYDKMLSELTNQTLNSTDNNVEYFSVNFSLSSYGLTASVDPGTTNDIPHQILHFAQNVLEDSPQFYWTDSMNTVAYTLWTSGGAYHSIELRFMVDPAFKTSAARITANAQMNAAVESFASVIENETTVYGKLKAVNDKLVRDTYYDISSAGSGKSAHAQNAYGCLVKKKCVCNGYAKAFELVCNRYGITDTIRVTGKLHDAFKNTNVDHAWNACLVSGKWYFVDVTANDPLKDTSGGNEYNDPSKYDKYFLIGSTQLLKDHVIETNAVPYPTFEAVDFTEPSLSKTVKDGVEYCAISNASDLKVFAGMVGYYSDCPNALLTADIDLGGAEFSPIGNDDHPFNGTFDGAGHSIKGLNVNNNSASAGLFGTADKAVIKDLTLTSGTVVGSTDSDKACGALAGKITSDTVIRNCDNIGVIVSGNIAGGLVGCINTGASSTPTGMIDGCTNSGTVKDGAYGGGIVGLVNSNKTVTIKDCISKGSVTSDKSGSFVGKAVTNIKLRSSLSTVPREVYGEKGTNTIDAQKVCIVGFVSSVDGVAFADNTIDGAAAYALGWGQTIWSDAMPDPSYTSAAKKVYRLEYTINSSKYASYFNKPFKATMFPSVELPEGYEWVYKGKTAVPSELAGLAEDISLTAEKLEAYISDNAFMTLGESMSYCWLIGAGDDFAAKAQSGTNPVTINVKLNEANVSAIMSGVKTVGGKKYICYSVDLPAKNLADKMTCEISFTKNGSQYKFVSNERSAAGYLTKLANDSSLSADIRNAAVSILNYAASVQTYKGYNTDNLANSGIAPALKNTAAVSKNDITANEAVMNTGNTDMSLRAVTVNMLNKIALRAYYKLENSALTAYQNGTLKFDYTAPDGSKGSKNIGVSSESSGICGREGEYIWVELPEGISPKNYADQAEIALRNGSEIGDSLKYSVLNYISAKCDTTRGMEKVAAALYRYYTAVKAIAE